MTVDKFWQEFLEATNRDKNLTYYDCFHFCHDEKFANELLELVLAGKKTATAASFLSYEAEGISPPQVGSLSIVTNFAGEPYCVIETTAVTKIPFNEMTYDICKREGEDDTLESWQEGHRRFFKMDAEMGDYEFTEDMPVLFEDFKVVYKRKF